VPGGRWSGHGRPRQSPHWRWRTLVPGADGGAAKKEGTDGGDDSSVRPEAKLPLAGVTAWAWRGRAAMAFGHWRNFGWHVHRWRVAGAWQRMLAGENRMTDARHASRRPNGSSGAELDRFSLSRWRIERVWSHLSHNFMLRHFNRPT